MEVTTEILENGIQKISLTGRMDVLGSQAIDLKFSALIATKKALVMVDMSEVSFLASLGMRILLSSAKGLSAGGGFLVLYKPQENVRKVLESSGVTSLIPTYGDELDALADLLARC